MFMFFSRKNEFLRFSEAQMHNENSLLFSGAKFKLIASVVAEKNASKVQDYKINYSVIFINREVQGV